MAFSFSVGFCILVIGSILGTALSERKDWSYLNVDFMMRDRTKSAGKNVSFRCEISGSPMPHYSWFKDDIEIGKDNNDRFKQTLKPWGSRLNIKNVVPEDSGYYTCKATNKVGQKSTTAYLSIDGASDSSDRYHPEATGSSADNNDNIGFCQPHRASACSRVMRNEMIYVTSVYDQNLKEEKLIAQLTVLASSSMTSDDCLEHAVQFLCYLTFPLCTPNNTNPTPLKMCRDECEAVVEDICKTEFTHLLQHPLFDDFRPKCNDLPSTSSDGGDKCKSINISVNNPVQA